jgi:ubiquinone/menaquinone biosynthesis C-methylase UbiE
MAFGAAGQRILDLGTGTGVLARAFVRRGAKVTGVDISANQIAEAKKLAEEEHLDVTFLVGKAEDIAFENSSFDVVTAGQAWIYFVQVAGITLHPVYLNHNAFYHLI